MSYKANVNPSHTKLVDTFFRLALWPKQKEVTTPKPPTYQEVEIRLDIENQRLVELLESNSASPTEGEIRIFKEAFAKVRGLLSDLKSSFQSFHERPSREVAERMNAMLVNVFDLINHWNDFAETSLGKEVNM